MHETQVPYRSFIGFDVSKDSITSYHSGTGQIEEIANTSQALGRYIRSLDRHCLAVCEPTGGYEGALLDGLAQAGVPTHRADARKVKAFIRSLGIHGKSDSIDARALAAYGRERQAILPLWSMPDDKVRDLKALVARRQDLSATRTAEKNRRQAPSATAIVKRSCSRLLKLIEQEIKELQDAIEAVITSDDNLKDRKAVLTTITGIGPVVATSLIAAMPELGTLTRRQAASLAGLAPHPRQSGKYDGYRKTCGGRGEVKRTLFMAAIVAAKHDKALGAFYQNLVANGKKPIVAITAIMRKIITIANAKVRDMLKQKQMS